MISKKSNKIIKSLSYSVGTKQQTSISNAELKHKIDNKFKEINIIILSVVIILLVMVGTIVINSYRFSSTTYREYSEKINTLDILQDSNNELLKQNKEYQEDILENQKQILKLLNQ